MVVENYNMKILSIMGSLRKKQYGSDDVYGVAPCGKAEK